ncbi:MAG: hypothetical protein EHM47_00315 [Ignavibacteriales bacterium]|nr:MAG: hypothetical protein EHM47_00315 [Ignavibacteriales bacterium]
MKLLLLVIILGCSCLYSAENFRIIYIIHGDGNYLFHDKDGKSLNAAGRILEQAKLNAENINRGEVFIFYQKPAEKFLFFNKDDGEFYYYKNSELISEETYSRKDADNFETEAGLIKKYSEDKSFSKKNILLYYGHEIPLNDSSGYHNSYPQKVFGINIFADGLGRIINSLSNDEKFNLIVLSTCRNGNENFASVLSLFTNYLIASPADIHLSYMDSGSLISLIENTNSIAQLSEEFARSAFEKLINSTHTEISINLYDLDDGSITEFYRAPEFGIRKKESAENSE